MKSIYSRVVACLLALGCAQPLQAAIVQYNITFDGSISGNAGTGSFQWDDVNFVMSSLVWDFGGGLTGGATDAALLEPLSGGETRGAGLFEMMTGADVAAGTSSSGKLAFSPARMIGPFPASQAQFSGIDRLNEEAEYVFSSDILHTGTYQVSLVPVPAAVWLFISGFIGLVGLARGRA